jgi:LPXTG-motif cell wall-anchored protein
MNQASVQPDQNQNFGGSSQYINGVPKTTGTDATGGSTSTSSLLLYGGLALGAVYFLNRNKRQSYRYGY